MEDKALFSNPRLVKRLGRDAVELEGEDQVWRAPPRTAQPSPASQPSVTKSAALPTTNDTNHELFRVRAAWIVDFFPDELIIQEKTVSIIRNSFLVSFVETLPIKDIGRVILISTPIYDGIQILGKNVAHDLHIKGLTRDKALYAKEVLEGLLLEEKGAVDVPQWLRTDEKDELLAAASRGDLHHLPPKHHHGPEV